MTSIFEAAKAGLAENTGFDSPKVVSMANKDGLYHVIVDITERTGSSGLLRTYDVAVDASGELHGYSRLASGNSGE